MNVIAAFINQRQEISQLKAEIEQLKEKIAIYEESIKAYDETIEQLKFDKKQVASYIDKLLRQSFKGWPQEAINGYNTAMGSVVSYLNNLNSPIKP